ncbi:MAG: hypothetical protein NVS3B17_04350 [Vulcanimicrobiaceae bacterium]
MRSQRGFTIPELLVAMMLLTVLVIASIGALQFFTKVVDARTFSDSGAAAVDHTMTTMRSDAATAFAVFVPTKDVFGFPNATAGAPAHEVDYYAKTDTGAETWWAYRYDVTRRTLQRYDYDPTSGKRGVFDRTNGTINTAGSYPALTEISAFTAEPILADSLVDDRRNKYAPIVQAMVGVGNKPQANPVGFIQANGYARSDLYGGNTTVQISLASRAGRRTIHVATGALPSGFTLHEPFSIRAFVYRVDTVHRFWFGFAQKTKAHVYEQLQYSFNPLSTRPEDWKVWCDYQVFPFGRGGIELGDINREYRPLQNFNESAGFIYYQVTHGGNFQNLEATPECKQHVPTINDTPAPAPTIGTPDVFDTPPPCFSAGTCWPENAPPNWTAPSPWPSSSPPPAWCATHQLSTVCGGPGGTPVPTVSAPPSPSFYSSPPPTAAPT